MLPNLPIFVAAESSSYSLCAIAGNPAIEVVVTSYNAGAPAALQKLRDEDPTSTKKSNKTK